MSSLERDTLLRVLRRWAPSDEAALHLKVVGIDDWAWRRGHSYCTVVCDLERRKVVSLLPDRDAETVEKWLKAHPDIRIVARDRGGTYARAATRGAPDATQVADRWHLFANASDAFLEAVRQMLAKIRDAVGSAEIDTDLLTSAERRQLEGAKRREETNRAILALGQRGVSQREIARRVGRNRATVRRVLSGRRADVFRPRQSSLAPFVGILEREWQSGCRNGAELWWRLKDGGFSGGLRVVTEWANRRRHDDEAAAVGRPRKCPSSRAIEKMMTTHRESASAKQAITMEVIDKATPELVVARDLLDEFHSILRDGRPAALDASLCRAGESLMAPFARGVTADLDAVTAALTEAWSSGQVEGQNTRIKLVKRQMYGRGKLDLVAARVIGRVMSLGLV